MAYHYDQIIILFPFSNLHQALALQFFGSGQANILLL